MAAFVGRSRELAALAAELARVTEQRAADRPGRALLIRGRRRVGKSRLVEEFIERSGVPSVYFTASKQAPARELSLFTQSVAESDLPGASVFADVVPATWESGLTLLAAAVPQDTPCIVVIDELPYLTSANPAIEGTLQKVFDKALSRRPVLLIGIGSDLAMMEALNEYGRPFHQRAKEMIVPALAPSEVGAMLDLSPEDALDAYLVTGGLPLVADEWPAGMAMWEYVESAFMSSTSALVVSGERMLAAEFPVHAQARGVLTAIGTGESAFTSIANSVGGIQPASLNRSLATLIDKRIVAIDLPLSTVASKERRYRIDDPYLRFWLKFVGPSLAEIERGAGRRALDRARAQWPSWRGRAIEPIVRTAVERMGDAGPSGRSGLVGGYWTRSNDPEIDLVVAESRPAKSILAVGSIKWHESAPFDGSDLARLIVHRSQLPGASESTPLIAVSRTPVIASGVTAIRPADLLAAW